MKTKSILLMTCAAFMVACSNDSTVTDVSTNDAISFTSSIKSMTKAVYTNETFDKFKVYAFVDGSDRDPDWSDDVVKVNANKWVTSQIRNWPEEGDKQLTFFAYAPSDLNPTISRTEQKLAEFTPKSALADQQDIVTAYNTGTRNGNKQGVDLKFRHALTQIEILATNEDVLRYKVEVLGSKLVRVKNKATMTFPTSATEAATWSGLTGEQSYRDKLPAAITLNATPQRVMNDGNNWMMLPQQLTAWNKNEGGSSNGGAYIAVLLRISYAGGDAIYPNKKEGAPAKFAYAAIPVATNWEIGHKYTYTLKFFGKGGGAGVVADDLTNPNAGAGNDSDVDEAPGKTTGQPIIDGVINFNVQIKDWVDGAETTETIEN